MQNGNNVNKEPITIEGLEKLKNELIFLKEKKRPEIVNAIAETISGRFFSFKKINSFFNFSRPSIVIGSLFTLFPFSIWGHRH